MYGHSLQCLVSVNTVSVSLGKMHLNGLCATGSLAHTDSCARGARAQ